MQQPSGNTDLILNVVIICTEPLLKQYLNVDPSTSFSKIIHVGSYCQVALETNMFRMTIENDAIFKGRSLSNMANQGFINKAIQRDALTVFGWLLIWGFFIFSLLNAPFCLDILYPMMHFLKIKRTHIFKAPEVPKKIVPEEKVREAVPKKPEVPPAKGIQWC